MEHRDLPERTAVLETNEKNIFHQLNEIKDELKELHHLTTLCEAISAKLTSSQEKMSEMESRLLSLERAPGEDLRHYKRSAVVYLITAILAGIVSALTLLFGKI